MKGDRYDYRLLAKVREAKYTQAQFANLLNIHIVTLSRMENGKTASYDLIMRACQLLDLDSSKIFYSNRQVSFAT
jgi:transcriptional regulator with XRE-family HTH domain